MSVSHSGSILDGVSSLDESEFFNEGDVSGLGVILSHSLDLLPSVPLGLSLEVKHAWSGSVHISDSSLFE